MISYGHSFFGGIAQLVERLNGIQKVRSSTLLTSTIKKETKKRPGPRPGLFCCPDPPGASGSLAYSPRRHQRNARAWALHRSAYGLTTVPIPCVSVPSWKIELLFMAFPHRPAGALCSPWPWKVCRFAPARSVLRSPGAKAPFPCRGVGQRPTPSNPNSFSFYSIGVRQHAKNLPKSARSAFPSLCVLRVLCDFQSFWQSFVHLRGPLCSL